MLFNMRSCAPRVKNLLTSIQESYCVVPIIALRDGEVIVIDGDRQEIV